MPCAGKSTLVDNLAGFSISGLQLVSENQPVIWGTRRLIRGLLLGRFLRQFKRTHLRFYSLVEGAFALLPTNQQEKIERDFINSVSRFQLSRKQAPGKAFLASEGFLQRLLSICVWLPDEKSRMSFIKTYLELMPAPSLIIHVEIGADMAKFRLSNTNRLEQGRSVEFDWAKWETSITLTTRALLSYGLNHKIDGSLPPSEAAKDVREVIQENFPNRAPGDCAP